MLAVDTNIVVRLLVQDDADQYARVTALLRTGTVRVVPTVMLETEWVLRSVYRLPSAQVLDALRSLLALDELLIESAAAVTQALEWFERGMDFADAVHLATTSDCDGLMTFDRDFVRVAGRLRAGTVAEP